MMQKSKPVATATIEPIGPRRESPRDHSILITLALGTSAEKYGDRAHVAAVAREALAGFSRGEGAPDARRVSDVATTRRTTKAGMPVLTRTVVGIEASTTSAGRPPAAAVATLRKVLEEDGYRVAVRAERGCAESGCNAHVMLEWDHASEVPPRWHSATICGAHDYRVCPRCKSTHALSCVNAAGQAPSVHCEVCGQVLVEWGASKVWTATLVKRA
jgi:hypothetical protein